MPATSTHSFGCPTDGFGSILDALDTLRERLRDDATPAAVLAVLEGLQRRGLSHQDLTVHIERFRAVNEVHGDDEALDERCLLALEIVDGRLVPALCLRWDAPAA